MVFLFSIGHIRSYTLGLRGAGGASYTITQYGTQICSCEKCFSEYSTMCLWSCYSQQSYTSRLQA